MKMLKHKWFKSKELTGHNNHCFLRTLIDNASLKNPDSLECLAPRWDSNMLREGLWVLPKQKEIIINSNKLRSFTRRLQSLNKSITDLRTKSFAQILTANTTCRECSIQHLQQPLLQRSTISPITTNGRVTPMLRIQSLLKEWQLKK